MRTSNPTLRTDSFEQFSHTSESQAMTVQGAINKSAILLTLLLVAASWTWGQFMSGVDVTSWLMGGLIGGFIVALITVFKKEWAPVTAPIYALLEGVVLGALSAIFEQMYSGIVFQAVFLTMGVFVALLTIYKIGLIQVTDKFRMGVFAATAGIGLIYLATFILGFFGVNIPLVHEGGLLGIGFSIFVVIIAAMNLALDFDFIEKGAACNAPRFMEWYAAFGLMVTLIWLYIEILRLLAKINSRR